MIAKNKKFTGIIVELDGGKFENCTFKSCKIVYSGYLSVTLDVCNFDDCKWEFTGPALNTVGFMKKLHAGGLTDLIENTCGQICGQAPGPGQTLH